MNFEFDNVVPIVQEKKKYSNFTIREIGDPTEIIQWRKEQEAKQEAYRARLSLRDARIGEYELKTGQKLDAPTIHTTTWVEKQAFVQRERERLAAPELVSEYPQFVPAEPPKKTLFQWVKYFFKRVWQNANF